MRDELISFETAVLAKEKGYSLPITKYSEKYYNKEIERLNNIIEYLEGRNG